MNTKTISGTDRALSRVPVPHPSTEPGQRPCPPDAIPAELLFQGGKEILVAHGGETYRLRITRNGKLILTK
jgi:hemin uptake protein HemP